MSSIVDVALKKPFYAARSYFRPLDAKPVPLERAIEIFDYLESRQEINFRNIRKCCTERAQQMCDIVRYEMGIKPLKAWVFAETEPQEIPGLEGKVRKNLWVDYPDGTKLIDANWWFHVTFALPIQLPDGNVVQMAFDPGLFDGPVLATHYAKTLNQPEYRIQENPVQVIADGRIPTDFYGAYHPDAYERSKEPGLSSEDVNHISTTYRFPSPFRLAALLPAERANLQTIQKAL